MESLRVENLRTLKDTGFVEIRPITVLLGNNSSGKSTFLRLFPLLRQSVEERTRGPLLWFGRLADFGSFTEAVSEFADEQAIRIGIRFRISPDDLLANTRLQRRARRAIPLSRELLVEHSFTASRTASGESSYVSLWKCVFADNVIEIRFAESGKIESFTANGRDYTNLVADLRAEHSLGVLPILRAQALEEAQLSAFGPLGRQRSPLYQNLVKALGPHVHHRTGDSRVRWLTQSIELGESKDVLAALKHSDRGGDHFKHKAKDWTVVTPAFREIRDAALALAAESLLGMADDHLIATFRSVSYVAPMRATAERYYRIQDLSVDSVDPQGRNLAVFLRSLKLGEQERFSAWTKRHFGFTAHVRTTGGHISLYVRQDESTKEFNLADIGFGFSQVLPVLTQLWLLTEYRGKRPPTRGVPLVFCIEQPELHLHPKFQATLADAFTVAIQTAKAAGIDLRIVIETHSETIINQLGLHVATSQIPRQDVAITVFDRPSAGKPTSIRRSEFDDEGMLTNWPVGFFDPIPKQYRNAILP